MSDISNIYAGVVFDLHPKVKDFIDELNDSKQIDLDQSGYPFLVRINRQNGNFVVQIARNNKLENFILNPRKQARPLISWGEDGFMRDGGKRVIQIAQPEQPDENAPRVERQKRVAMESYRKIVDQILEG